MAIPLLTISVDPSTGVLRLVGEIDLATSHLLVEAVDDAVERGISHLVIDFGGVTFVNSTGLGTLVAATRRLRASGGDLVLRHFSGIPATVLATSGLDRLFTIES